MNCSHPAESRVRVVLNHSREYCRTCEQLVALPGEAEAPPTVKSNAEFTVTNTGFSIALLQLPFLKGLRR